MCSRITSIAAYTIAHCRDGIRNRQRVNSRARVYNVFLAESSARNEKRSAPESAERFASIAWHLSRRISDDGAISASVRARPKCQTSPCPPLSLSFSLSPALTFEKEDLPGRRPRVITAPLGVTSRDGAATFER